jgi:hypothetical protein
MHDTLLKNGGGMGNKIGNKVSLIIQMALKLQKIHQF